MLKYEFALRYYIDGKEVKEINKYGKVRYYIDGDEIKEKNKYGDLVYYIDGTLTREQLYALISII